GVFSVLVVYLLVNVALLAVLPVPTLARSTLPAADAAQAIFGDKSGRVMTLLSLVSLPPLLNAILMIGTRILFPMGRDGPLPPPAPALNRPGGPRLSAPWLAPRLSLCSSRRARSRSWWRWPRSSSP